MRIGNNFNVFAQTPPPQSQSNPSSSNLRKSQLSSSASRDMKSRVKDSLLVKSKFFQKMIEVPSSYPLKKQIAMRRVTLSEANAESKKVDTIPLHPIFLTPLVDTVKPPYKRITTFEYPFKSNISMEGVDIDMLPHRSAEDLFQWNHHIYLRDKFEFGQINELLVNGLGLRYQQIVLDDILINDPLTMKANWQMLTTEEFSRFEIMRGFESFSRGSSPITVDFQTADYVAALGYTHLRFQDYNSKSTQVNGAFTINFSDRFNFFGNYTIETNSGLRRSGMIEPNSFALHHKINIRFRYEFAPRTYFILSGRYNELNLLPFGGYNLENPSNRENFRQTSFFGTPANPNSKSKFSIGVFKMEMILPTFKTNDFDNQLKIWVSTALFNQNYFVAARAIDTAFSIRSQLGLNQALNFDFLRINGRVELVWDNISNQNLVKTPVANATSLTGSVLAQLAFNDLLPNTDFKASLSGNISQINRIPKYNAAPIYSVFLPSFGGDFKFTFKMSDGNIRIGFFGNANFTSRSSSLEETYGRDTLAVGIGAEAVENIRMLEAGFDFFLKSPLVHFNFSASLASTSIMNPMILAQYAPELNQKIKLFYTQLSNEQFEYLNASVYIKLVFWKFEFEAKGSITLNHNYLKNLNEIPIIFNPTNSLEYGYNISSKKLFYLPWLHGQVGFYFHSKVSYDQLDLKFGVLASGLNTMSNALRNNERMGESYFNIYYNGTEYYDNNIAFNAEFYSLNIDAQLFMGFRQISFYLFVENIGQSIGYHIPVFFKLPPNLIRFGVSWTMID